MQSNSLTFSNVQKIFYKSYCCKKILTMDDISFQVSGAMPYLKNILSHNKLNAFNTNIGNNIVCVFFNFVKEFENKIGAFTAMPMRLFHFSFLKSQLIAPKEIRRAIDHQICNKQLINKLFNFSKLCKTMNSYDSNYSNDSINIVMIALI